MKVIRTVCFDVDGVLLDSLGAHLQVCTDKSLQYGLKLRIPSPQEFREMVQRDIKISPMEQMFQAVGFPKKFAIQADEEYQATFARDYRITPFPGVEEMLSSLKDAGLRFGIVTSNVKANVEEALGGNLRFFDPNCIFTKDGPSGASKVESLKAVLHVMDAVPSECLYIGDQPADWKAAREVGCPFLGVTYGWGISRENQDFPTVDEVAGITEFVRQTNAVVLARK